MIKHKDGSITHVGQVLGVSEYWNSSMDIMSYSARVWEEGTVKTIPVYDDYSNPEGAKIVVDATEEVKIAYMEWLERNRIRREAEEAALEAAIPRVGKTVEVIKGRKVAKGTTGKVFWKGIDKFKTNRWATVYRLGVKTEQGETIWIAEDNVKVVA
jgi:hypothetical protein